MTESVAKFEKKTLRYLFEFKFQSIEHKWFVIEHKWFVG